MRDRAKVCAKCGEEKSAESFSVDRSRRDGLRGACKSCLSEHKKMWIFLNKDKVKESSKIYRKRNRAKIAQAARLYALKNGPKIAQAVKLYRLSAQSREARRLHSNQYQKLPRVRERIREREKSRYSMDIEFRLSKILRSRLRTAVRKGRGSDGHTSAVRDLQCTVSELRQWIEMFWQPEMTWDNYGRGSGKWEIDHIEPLASFDLTDREQVLRAVCFTNLQPLWYEDHLRKTVGDIRKCV